MREALNDLMPLVVLVGIPLATYAQLSIARELEQRIHRCGTCSVCVAKEQEDKRLARDARFRREGMCVRGHGTMKQGRCQSCGWS